MSGPTSSSPRFIVTVDDPGGLIQDLDLFWRTADFFRGLDAPATFFVVPRGAGDFRLDRQTEWLTALHEAESHGHSCQLHGLDHTLPEFGPYEWFIRAMNGQDPEAELQADTERYGHLWRRELFVERLQTALDIFGQAMGRRPQCFRSGALSQCGALYEALGEVGLHFTSNKVVDPRGWAYLSGRYDEPGAWDPTVPPHPYYLTDQVTLLPMISEYAWMLKPEQIEPHLALALEDLQRVYAQGGIFLLICHVQCVGAADGLSQKLLERLIRTARDEYGARFETVSDLIGEIEAGEVTVR